MGRMADARKRARRPGSKTGSRKKKAPASPDAPTDETTVPAAEPEEASSGVTLPPSGLASDVLGDEPAAPESGGGGSGKIELPSSGLAAESMQTTIVSGTRLSRSCALLLTTPPSFRRRETRLSRLA